MQEKARKINGSPTLIPRPAHIISRANISDRALKVLYQLKDAGYQAYLVGGCVRDLLLGREPKDFDVATDALPEEVKRLFRNCRLIGRRFRLAHVHFGREIIEVATFRAQHDEGVGEGHVENGRILRDNVYGTLESDAWRRDFTINALYYDIRDFSVIDYTGGLDDLNAGVLRLIGEPEQRYREDPVRMLRAVRFAARLGFRIDAQSEQKIFELGHLLNDISEARLYEEVLKLFHGGCALQTFELLRHYRLFGHLFPQTEASLEREDHGFPMMLLVRALENTDTRIAEGKPVTPAFLVAALLWDPMRMQVREARAQGLSELQAIQQAGYDVLKRQAERVSIPKRFSLPAREIWAMQPRLERRTGRRPLRLVEHPRFRAAYDLLLLRAAAGEDLRDLCDWWTRFQEAPEDERMAMTQAVGGSGRQRRPRKRRPAAAGS